MCSSDLNTIEVFTTKKQLEKKVKTIVTDSTPLEEPKEYETCNVYQLAKLFLDEEELKALQARYKSGKEGYGHFKLYLAEVIWNYFAPYREKREYYLNHMDEVEAVLKTGAAKAREAARPLIEKLREATGVRYGG